MRHGGECRGLGNVGALFAVFGLPWSEHGIGDREGGGSGGQREIFLFSCLPGFVLLYIVLSRSSEHDNR